MHCLCYAFMCIRNISSYQYHRKFNVIELRHVWHILVLKAILQIGVFFSSGENDEFILKCLHAISAKNRMSERAKPVPLQIAKRWSKILEKEGVDFQAVIDQKVRKFNYFKGANPGVTINDQEVSFMKLVGLQSQDLLVKLEDHWQNFKAQELAA